ncbi:MAG: SpoIIE family protein phosphatase [Candidatus Aminicenantes bacterium]|nr:SpoIIE family protein phosphatase [Candidatus Aminicenantes bacterium]
MAKLFIYPKKGDPFHIKIEAKPMTLGRAAENEIPVPDPFCSNKHARVFIKENKVFIQDNNSKNGVFVNGKRIQNETELKKGDEILMGSTRIVYDLKIDTKVEMTDDPSSSANINTILHLKDVLKKPDISTTIRADAKSLDIDVIKSEHRDFSVISEVSKALILHKPLDELLEHIMDLISERIDMDRGILMLKEDDQFIPKVVRINNKQFMNQKIQVSQSIINTAVDRHSSLLISDVQSDARFSAQDSILKLNIQSAMCVPLWNNKEIIGIIYSDRISLLQQYTDDDLRLLTLLSNLAAVKIENAMLFEQALEKEKMEKELALAAQIQQDLLPKTSPDFNNYEIVGVNLPCYLVGGDYYDYVIIDEDRIAVVIADVSGKGVSASLLMASLRAALHAEISPDYDIKKMAAKLNNFVHSSSSSNSFISFCYCELNRQNGEIRYINSGHNPPIIIDKKKGIKRMETCGLCLGMFPKQEYEPKTLVLNPGDTALLDTGGFTESRNAQNEEFSEEGLIRLLKKSTKLSAGEIITNICEALKDFTTGTAPFDDMTLVIIKRTG